MGMAGFTEASTVHRVGALVVMPNHFHGSLIFHDMAGGATRHDLTHSQANPATLHKILTDGLDGSPGPGSRLPHGPQPAPLGAGLAQFKSRLTKRLWKFPALNGTPIWQRNYHDRLIRNEGEIDARGRHLEANPVPWNDDD